MNSKSSACLAFALACFLTPSFAAPPNIGGCQILPTNNYWNTPVDTLPLHPLSATWVTSIGANTRLHPDWGNNLANNFGIPFDIVPGTQPNVPILFNPVDNAADESDPGPYPIPPNAQVEGGLGSVGDRHVLVLENTNCRLYELFSSYPQNGGAQWEVYSSAKFDLNSNALRTSGWTSADAAGYTILPGLVRWEEIAAGEINHAIRFTAAAIFGQNASGQKQFIWPARHWSSDSTVATQPPMGARFRLKASFDITPFHSTVQVLLRAFKKYGIFLADRGSNWYFSGTSNTNFPPIFFTQLKDVNLIKGSDFEAVDTLLLQIDPNTAQAVQPPGAPTSVTATVGNAQATFSFTAPTDNGGKPVLDYTVTCNPGARTATATASPITLSGLTNGVALACTVAARNLVFPSIASTPVNVTPGQGVLSAAPASVDFGPSAIATATAPRTITVTNTGSGSTSVLTETLTGVNALSFSRTSTCSGVALTAGTTCSVSVTFNPSTAGPYSASLNLSGATTSPVTIALSGSGIAVPDAPIIGTAIAGNTQLSINFTPPASNGGSPITTYTATCVGGGSFSASRTTSPITVTGLANLTTYTCSVTATNAAGVSAASATVNATPDVAAAPALINIVSRKLHTGVGTFDIDLAPAPLITDPATVEPRTVVTGTGHTIFFQFNVAVTAAGTVAAINAATMQTIAGVTSTAAGNNVIVTIPTLPDNTRVRITIDGVNGIAAPRPASVGFLVGDINNTRSVTASDISGVKARSGQTTTAANFRFDVNVSGAINSSDISAVKARSGLVLP